MSARTPRFPRYRPNADFLETDYRTAVADMPGAWIAQAQSLLRAYRILMAQSKIDVAEAEVGLQKMSTEMAAANEIVPEAYDASVAAQAWMLAGFSIEVSLKGLIVLKANQTPGTTLRFSHDLIELARDADVPLSREEQVLCDVLTEITVWRGRYPIPMEKRAADLVPRVAPNGLVGTSGPMADLETFLARLIAIWTSRRHPVTP